MRVVLVFALCAIATACQPPCPCGTRAGPIKITQGIAGTFAFFSDEKLDTSSSCILDCSRDDDDQATIAATNAPVHDCTEVGGPRAVAVVAKNGDFDLSLEAGDYLACNFSSQAGPAANFACAAVVVEPNKVTTVNFSFVGDGSGNVEVVNPDGSPGGAKFNCD